MTNEFGEQWKLAAMARSEYPSTCLQKLKKNPTKYPKQK
jgi:hypothetical protein